MLGKDKNASKKTLASMDVAFTIRISASVLALEKVREILLIQKVMQAQTRSLFIFKKEESLHSECDISMNRSIVGGIIH